MSEIGKVSHKKKYLVFINYGDYEGWKLQTETDDWQEAVETWDYMRSTGSECIITAYCPLIILDGREGAGNG